MGLLFYVDYLALTFVGVPGVLAARDNYRGGIVPRTMFSAIIARKRVQQGKYTNSCAADKESARAAGISGASVLSRYREW